MAALTISAIPIGQAAVGDVRVGKNYRMKTDMKASRHKDAIGLAVDPKDTKHIVSVNTDWADQECEFHTSFDGGRTWKGGDLQAPDGFPEEPCSSVGHGSSAMDQSVEFGSDNTVYTTFASAFGDNAGNSVLVAKSTNGGKTFNEATVALPGGASRLSGPEYRFPKLVVDPGQNGRDTIYLSTWRTGGNDPGQTPFDDAVLTVSRDGGETWTPPAQLNEAGERALEVTQPTLGNNNAVFVAWRQRGNEAFIRVARTTDDGTTVTRVNAVAVKGAVDTQNQFTGSTFPRLTSDPRDGNLYLVYNQGPFNGSYPGQTADHFIHQDLDVLFIRSTDNGETWSKPIVINETSFPNVNLTQTRHPNVTVAPNGRIDIVWQDRRHSYRMETCSNTHGPPAGTAPCFEARLGDTYYSASTDQGRNFTRNRRVTDRSMNNDVGLDYRFGTYWDFGPMAEPLGNDRILFGWMEARLGNVQNDAQDIFLAKMNLRPRGSAPVQRAFPRKRVPMSVKLSRFVYPGGAEATLASTFASRPWTRVVIAHKKDVASMLAGGVLGRAYLGPVLLSGSNGLPSKVKAEIDRLGPFGAFVLGDEGKLSRGVISDLEAAGVASDEIERMGGADAAETAALIAAEIDNRSDTGKLEGKPAFDAAVVVNPSRPDAVSASVLAANRRLPVLFTDTDEVPQATKDALASLDIDKTLVIGGAASVSDAAMAALPGAERLGSNRLYATSREVVQESVRRAVPDNIVYVADGKRRYQGALMGATVGRAGGLLLLSPRAKIGAARTALGNLGLGGRVDRLITVRRS